MMLKPGVLGGDLHSALARAIEHAPYLNRLHTKWVTDGSAAARHTSARAWLDEVLATQPASQSIDDVMTWLRQMKQGAHLAIAAGDVSGEFRQPDVTQALTLFADTAVQAALGAALHARGLKPGGIFVIALGKMGAGELNYSSDIDVVAMYDPSIFDGGDKSPGEAAVRVVRDIVRILEELTGDGYVFRTDLRLRPDPGSTPLCVSTDMADVYYESVGQNWERMVWIKARACAGDLTAASAFLKTIEPFVWRRHLDYWAIGDIHAIKRMVNSKVGDPSLADPAADVKLGPGGIREIEFFAQTQQLILGGRNPALRTRGTIEALAALRSEGVVSEETETFLHAAYHTLRAAEHRIQMRHDQQTHTLPRDDSERSAVAALMGAPDLSRFDAGILEIRRKVHEIYRELFADEERRTAEAEAGNLVFTGVDDDPGTVQTLSEMGFSNPPQIIETIRRWHRGHTPATRTARGRGLLTALLPSLLNSMAETGEADTAFLRFSNFFEQLSSGVQTLSMLLAEPNLLNDLVATLALAPRLATTLGRRPDLLEALIEGSAQSQLIIPDDASFEDAMNFARQYHRDRSFLIGHRLLHGRLGASEAGFAFSDLADELISAMAAVAEQETTRRFGERPGAYVVAALGKLGGRELSATSDLDLIVIYDAPGAEAPQTWFTKFTQRLITALSAPTGEGDLYEVDMRLRPSGNSGPVATSLDAFERYQREVAWTWEHMALTRLRAVAGDADLKQRLQTIAARVLAAPRDAEKIRKDIYDMRQRLSQEKPGRDLWQLKTAPGGLIDVEFVTQQALLFRGEDALFPSTQNALASLSGSGDLDPETVDALRRHLKNLQCLQQVLRLAVGEAFDADTASSGLKDRLARVIGAASFTDASSALAEGKKMAADIRCKNIGPLATD